jgi:hypothetical protein
MEAKKAQEDTVKAGIWITSKQPANTSTNTTLKTPVHTSASGAKTRPVGLSAVAKAANIQYPLYQPKFSPPHGKPHHEPPPPPPPPPNRYKVTLGTKAAIVSTKKVSASGMMHSPDRGSPLPIRGHIHPPKHDVIRVHTRSMAQFYDSEENEQFSDEDAMSQMSPGRRQQVCLFIYAIDI